jgi:hypothetical protein
MTMAHHKTRDLTLGAALGLAFGLGCPYDDTDHCSVEDGDAYCARKYPDEPRQYCAVGHGTCEDKYYTEALDGCVAAQPAEAECYSPCGGRKSAQDDDACDGQADASTSSVTGTGTEATTEPTGGPTTQGTGSMSNSGSETDTGSSSTAPGGCVASIECIDPEAPICEDTECVPCSTDEQCADRDAGMPACRADGQCVACTPSNASACVDSTPVCNAANECEGCRFHEQCEGTACEIATGACFADTCVVEVDRDGGADYESIDDAIADGCVVVVRDAAGGYPEEVTIAGGISVAILAADGASPILAGSVGSGQPALEITGGATVYVQGLRINGNDMGGLGVEVNAATIYLDRTTVGGNAGGGITFSNAAEGHLRNCFVGGDVSDIAAVDVAGSSVEILYSTLGAGFGSAAALRCDGPASVDVRNSLLVARTDDPEVDCSTDSLETSATEADLGDMNTNWFTAGGFASGNFHLSLLAPAAILSAGEWRTGDPATDIDGELRPTEPGAVDAAGADVP